MPTNVTTVPADELTNDRKAALRSAAVDSALQSTVESSSKNKKNIVVRDIKPDTDLGLSNDNWELDVSNANQFSQVINHELSDNTTVTIHGLAFLDANPDVSAVQFKTGASTINEIQVQQALAEQNPVVYLNSPIKYDESTTVDVELYASTTGNKQVVLKGQTAEVEGEHINPSDA